MSETTTNDVVPAGETEQTLAATSATRGTGDETLDVAMVGGESPATVGTPAGETAREVAAQHFARLMYTPVSTWSRYTFHENEPHPYGSARRTGLRG